MSTAENEPDDRQGVDLLGGDTFPYVVRLELDQLLEQLIERARDVQATQGRLRGLLRANHAVAAAVDLDDVLRHILESARTLVKARYAALGLVDNGRLMRFLHVGMDEATVTAIGHLPEGKGLLGRLIDRPQPLRTAAIADHESSVGFPGHHPPMRSFLGVPIRIGDRVFGNLYLTDKEGSAEFSQDDEELAVALAAAAGSAITNAAAFSESKRRQQWQAAMAALSTAVLTSDDPEHAPELIVRHAILTADGVGASVVVADDDPACLRVVASEGVLAGQRGLVTPIAGTIFGDVMARREPIVIDDTTNDPRTASRAVPAAGPIAAVPMLTELAADGVLFLCRPVGALPFDALDLELLVTYATHAALVLQLARSRRDNELLRIVSEREHMAGELHTEVIQRLSRLGMDLQGLAVRVSDPALRSALESKVDDADSIIRALRAALTAQAGSDRAG